MADTVRVGDTVRQVAMDHSAVIGTVVKLDSPNGNNVVLRAQLRVIDGVDTAYLPGDLMWAGIESMAILNEPSQGKRNHRKGNMNGRGTDTKVTLQQIQDIDDNGLWVTARDADGLEVEVEVKGLTAQVLSEWLARHTAKAGK